MSNPLDLGGFELDLGNLEKTSGLIINDRQRTASVVNSHDDGPTDFTFNMGQWMHGTDARDKNDIQQTQAAEIQVEQQPIEQLALANDSTGKPFRNCHIIQTSELFSHISGFTDGTDGPMCSSTISPVRRKPRAEKKPTEQPAQISDTMHNTIGQNEHYSSELFSHISGFTDGTDGPVCSSTISVVRRKPKVEKQPIQQPAPASDTKYNTIGRTEPQSPDCLSHISDFTDGPDGPICSSTPSPVRRPKVKEVTNDGVYALHAPAHPRASDEVLPRAPNSPKPALRRGSGSSQNPPADDLPRSRLSSDPRAPGSPTPLARQSGLQRNPLVDAIIASRRITSPNSRAAAIVYVYLFLILSHPFSFVKSFSSSSLDIIANIASSNGVQPESISAPVQSRSRTNSQSKGTRSDTLPSQSRSRGNSETKGAQGNSQSRARGNSDPKESRNATLSPQSRSRGNSIIHEISNTTLPSQSRSRSNSKTQESGNATLPSQSRRRGNSNPQETSNTTLPSQSRSRSNSQTKEDKSSTLSANSRSRSNSQSKEHQLTTKAAPALSRLNTETKQNNAAEEVFTHISSLQAEIERLRLENQELRTANSSLERDNASYHTAYENIERAYQGLEREAEQQNEQQNNAYQALERENSKVQADFEDLQDRYRDREKAFASEMDDLKDHFRSYECNVATDLRSELKKVESNSRERETALTVEVKNVKSQCKDHIINLRRQHETEIRERDTALSLAKTESTTAKMESHTVYKEVAVMRAQLADLNEELVDTRAIQAQMEAHFKTTMKAREAEWQERLDVLLKERGTMSKALMTEWGRREMGDVKGKNGGQAYRYRYVKTACS